MEQGESRNREHPRRGEGTRKVAPLQSQGGDSECRVRDWQMQPPSGHQGHQGIDLNPKVTKLT